MEDVFEIVIPYLSSNGDDVLKTTVYTTSRDEVTRFVRQHNIKLYDVNILKPESLGKDFDVSSMLQEFEFASNHDDHTYRILTTEALIYEAIDYIAEQLTGTLMFGIAILRDEIPVIDVINSLIVKLKHTQILDYILLDTSYCNACDVDKLKHYKTFCNKAFELEDMPDNNDQMYDYIFDSLHNSSLLHGIKPESITIEGYVEYFATILTDRIN